MLARPRCVVRRDLILKEAIVSTELLDVAGRRRSPATMPGFRRGCMPANRGRRYPADPPRVEEIIAVMRAAGEGIHGARIRALVVILWRAGLRISEALALAETDLEPQRGSILIRRGKGGKRREVGMDDWAWEHVEPWRQRRLEMPVGPFLCVIEGATRGRPWSRLERALSSDDSPASPAYGAGSPRISCGTRTPSKWRAKASHYRSSSASSVTPTSA